MYSKETYIPPIECCQTTIRSKNIQKHDILLKRLWAFELEIYSKVTLLQGVLLGYPFFLGQHPVFFTATNLFRTQQTLNKLMTFPHWYHDFLKNKDAVSYSQGS